LLSTGEIHFDDQLSMPFTYENIDDTIKEGCWKGVGGRKVLDLVMTYPTYRALMKMYVEVKKDDPEFFKRFQAAIKQTSLSEKIKKEISGNLQTVYQVIKEKHGDGADAWINNGATTSNVASGDASGVASGDASGVASNDIQNQSAAASSSEETVPSSGDNTSDSDNTSDNTSDNDNPFAQFCIKYKHVMDKKGYDLILALKKYEDEIKNRMLQNKITCNQCNKDNQLCQLTNVVILAICNVYSCHKFTIHKTKGSFHTAVQRLRGSQLEQHCREYIGSEHCLEFYILDKYENQEEALLNKRKFIQACDRNFQFISIPTKKFEQKFFEKTFGSYSENKDEMNILKSSMLFEYFKRIEENSKYYELEKAELEKAELEKAELEKAELENAELEKAELEKLFQITVLNYCKDKCLSLSDLINTMYTHVVDEQPLQNTEQNSEQPLQQMSFDLLSQKDFILPKMKSVFDENILISILQDANFAKKEHIQQICIGLEVEKKKYEDCCTFMCLSDKDEFIVPASKKRQEILKNKKELSNKWKNIYFPSMRNCLSPLYSNKKIFKICYNGEYPFNSLIDNLLKSTEDIQATVYNGILNICKEKYELLEKLIKELQIENKEKSQDNIKNILIKISLILHEVCVVMHRFLLTVNTKLTYDSLCTILKKKQQKYRDCYNFLCKDFKSANYQSTNFYGRYN
jgi:uncharacterized protein YjbI with pentapeptide repeats